MASQRIVSRVACASLLLLFAACDRTPLQAPATSERPRDLPANTVLLECVASVAAGSIRCGVPDDLPDGVNADRIVGGQDRYVKLASSGTAYDGIGQIFRSTVTLQNLSRHYMGTPDGTTVEGVRIFFHSGPAVTSGTGDVSVANADGTDTFTGADQPYFEYGQILAPMEVSAGREWQFDVPSTVSTFTFSVFVSTPLVDEAARLLGPVWTGADSTSTWGSAGNWDLGTVPDSSTAATVPNDSLLGGAPHPVLSADATVRHLRVGIGSSLDLDGNRLEILGNLDAAGAIANGTVVLSSDSALAGGSVPALEVLGRAHLQRPTVAAGAVRVTGSLSTAGAPLTIAIP